MQLKLLAIREKQKINFIIAFAWFFARRPCYGWATNQQQTLGLAHECKITIMHWCIPICAIMLLHTSCFRGRQRWKKDSTACFMTEIDGRRPTCLTACPTCSAFSFRVPGLTHSDRDKANIHGIQETPTIAQTCFSNKTHRLILVNFISLARLWVTAKRWMHGSLDHAAASTCACSYTTMSTSWHVRGEPCRNGCSDNTMIKHCNINHAMFMQPCLKTHNKCWRWEGHSRSDT